MMTYNVLKKQVSSSTHVRLHNAYKKLGRFSVRPGSQPPFPFKRSQRNSIYYEHNDKLRKRSTVQKQNELFRLFNTEFVFISGTLDKSTRDKPTNQFTVSITKVDGS